MKLKIDKKAPSFNDQVCSYCGWKRRNHQQGPSGQGEYCYHYSDQSEDYFYSDKTFQP